MSVNAIKQDASLIKQDVSLLETLYERMVAVRTLEERLRAAFKIGQTRGPIHCCDGQEAVGIGATAALAPGDVVTSTHRGHAHYLGLGLSVERVVAEIFGRATGYCRGRAGHMLIAAREHGLLGGNAIVGGGLPIAVGQAWGFATLGRQNVSLCFFGDGAAQTGAWHESMNIAALWKLPVIFVCEHNEYGLTVPASRQSSTRDIVMRAAGYGMPAHLIDGNDALAVHARTLAAADLARSGGGPTFIEAKTYRMTTFSTSDMGGYQPPEEMESWRPRDPITRAAALLEGTLGADAVLQIAERSREAVYRAFDAALTAPLPDAAELFQPEFLVS